MYQHYSARTSMLLFDKTVHILTCMIFRSHFKVTQMSNLISQFNLPIYDKQFIQIPPPPHFLTIEQKYGALGFPQSQSLFCGQSALTDKGASTRKSQSRYKLKFTLLHSIVFFMLKKNKELKDFLQTGPCFQGDKEIRV